MLTPFVRRLGRWTSACLLVAGTTSLVMAETPVRADEGQVEAIEIHIIKAIGDAGGVLSLDRLLIALYRKTGEIHQRQKLTARLYRMIQKELLYSIPKKKGLYSTKPPTEAES